MTSTTMHTDEVTLTPNISVLRHDDSLLVRSGEQVNTINGAALVQLVSTLIQDTHQGQLPAPDADGPAWQQLVQRLEETGLVTREPGMAEVSPQARELWQRSGGAISLRQIDTALRSAVVPVIGTHEVAQRLRMMLQEAGVTTGETAAEAYAHEEVPGAVRLHVVVAQSVDDAILHQYNEENLDKNEAWLPVVMDDAGRAVIGPLIRPHSSACWKCYTLRRAANFPDRRVVGALSHATAESVTVPETASVGLSWFVAALAAEKVAERIALGDYSTMSQPGGFATVERAHPGVSVNEHKVLRVPRCPACFRGKDAGMPQVWHHAEVSA